MAEQEEFDSAEAAEPVIETGAAAIAAGLDAARDDPGLRPSVAAFFEAQRRLIEAQTHHLQRQLGQVRLTTVSAALKLVLQSLTLAAIFGVFILVGTMVRDAMDDHGLVIESFSAPPELAARGLTGQVLAQDVLGRVAAIRRIANDNSITVTDDVRTDGADSLKVEIPETGVSLGDVETWLHRKLGHAKRLTGAVSQDAAGNVAIELQLSGADPITAEGPAANLAGLLQQAAEHAFAAFDPVNYVLYLVGSGRDDDALAAAGRNAQAAITPLDLANGLSLWATVDGDRRRAASKALLAIRADPKIWAGWSECANANRDLGRDQEAIGCLRGMLRTHARDQWRNHQAAMPYLFHLARAALDRNLADYQGLEAEMDRLYPRHGGALDRLIAEATASAALHDCSGARRDLAWAATAGAVSPTSMLKSGWRIAVCQGDSPAALASAQGLVSSAQQQRAIAQQASVGAFDAAIATTYTPWLARALVGSGQVAQAQAVIATTPTDCYLCLRTRALVAAAAGDPHGADHWFAEAVRQAPSPPFAWLEWGQAKLYRHDLPGAIIALAAAHRASPTFADPLEVWGETLLASGDANAAAAKLSQASDRAPRWGRAQLKWAEALARLGRTDEARKRYTAAAGLDLSAAERAELARARL